MTGTTGPTDPNDPVTPPPPSPGLASAPPPAPGTALGPTGPDPAGTGGAVGPAGGGGWYSGPIPIAGLAPRETIGSAIGRTLVKSLTVLAVLAVGAVLIPILFIALIAALVGAGDAQPIGTPRSVVAGERGADLRLVAVPITGVILGEDRGTGGSLFGVVEATYGYTIKDELEALASDDTVDGIVLEIDSPGGTIFGARAIADGLDAYREATGKPVIAHVGGISASGGVYAMAGADAIYADHGTIIGSIGVIFGPLTFYDGVTAIDGGILGGGVTTDGGIEVEYLTAGRSKDFANPYRAITAEERAVLQAGLDDAYDDFVAHVGRSRGLPEADIRTDLGALIFGEQQALANGLIDGVANRDEAYRLAAEAAGLGDGETWVVERLDTPEPSLLGLLAQAGGGVGAEATGEGATTVATHPLCLGTGTILAFHGDPAQLCLPGG